jgi:hypothetical protein
MNKVLRSMFIKRKIPKRVLKRKNRRRRKKLEKQLQRELQGKYNMTIRRNNNNLDVIFKESPSNMFSTIKKIADFFPSVKSIRFRYNEENIRYVFSTEEMGLFGYLDFPIEVDEQVLEDLNKSLSEDKKIQKCRYSKCSPVHLVYSGIIYCDDCADNDDFIMILKRSNYL